MLSSSIAAVGLLADSAAVVIGAMLVAPLMTPILATAAATVRADNRELVIALGSDRAGHGAGDPGRLPHLSGRVRRRTRHCGTSREVRARTFPGLLDLGIAVTAGAAAGYITPRRATTGALPGVGIAVALVPPLATVGITYELGADDAARNALLLFVTNLAAIVFAASVMLLLAGFPTPCPGLEEGDDRSPRRDPVGRGPRRDPAVPAHPIDGRGHRATRHRRRRR